ncbi:MAG: shikimate dehydrogenase [Gammaproteobacteria bacterium]|jgi:shikimate dehydrogenase|nr:shikimate dehydrogenase [Gammaproteobacteria bacterium]
MSASATETTDQYGVVGHPVAHSWSPFIHGLFGRETGQAMSYRLYDFTPEEFHERVREFFKEGGRGLNITLPHKIAAVDVADDLTARAAHAAAVNTFAVRGDGTILGDNTDGAGLVRDLCDNLGIVITRRRILIIGAGGAARGVLAPLLALSPTEIVIANRTSERAENLAKAFGKLGTIQGTGFRYISGGAFDLIVNATSASLSGDIPAVPATVIGPQTVCYDMAYGKIDTPFVRWALKLGCTRALQGWGMLVEQAAESFRVWRGVRPSTAPVLAALKERATLPSITAS